MSKNHLKMPPALLFSGALSATRHKLSSGTPVRHAFPEYCRPFTKVNLLAANLFRSIVGHVNVESPTFALYNKGKERWQEQSLI